MSKRIFVLNGPNLNLLGQREPAIYGTTTLAEIEMRCEAKARGLGYAIDFRQTNFEGELVESVHQARQDACGIIINPAGYSFTSVALLDALNTFEGPVIECHISQVHKREAFRHHSYVSLRSDGVIAGFGTQGYQLGLRRIATLIDEAK